MVPRHQKYELIEGKLSRKLELVGIRRNNSQPSLKMAQLEEEK